jgi:putative transposase
MENGQSLTHTKWDCKYHIVWIPKYRKKKLYGQIQKFLGALLKDLATQKGCVIIEGHLQPDHVHILISIPPKYAVAQIVGFLKGKSAIHIARAYLGRRKNFTNQNFWARGYYVSTVGKEEDETRQYIKTQEKEDQRLDQLQLFEEEPPLGGE